MRPRTGNAGFTFPRIIGYGDGIFSTRERQIVNNMVVVGSIVIEQRMSLCMYLLNYLKKVENSFNLDFVSENVCLVTVLKNHFGL